MKLNQIANCNQIQTRFFCMFYLRRQRQFMENSHLIRRRMHTLNQTTSSPLNYSDKFIIALSSFVLFWHNNRSFNPTYLCVYFHMFLIFCIVFLSYLFLYWIFFTTFYPDISSIFSPDIIFSYSRYLQQFLLHNST